ncbi:MAG: hypothetical protein ACOVQ7_25265, partial [Limnoraphis robusta]|jgi:hypothetical protein
MNFLYNLPLPSLTMNPQELSEYVARIDEFAVDDTLPSRNDSHLPDQLSQKFIDPTVDGLQQILALTVKELGLTSLQDSSLLSIFSETMYQKLLELSFFEKQAIAQTSSMETLTGEAAHARAVERLNTQLQGTFAELRKDLLFIISLAWAGTQDTLYGFAEKRLDQYTLNKLIHYHAGTAINRVNQHLKITYEITEEPVEPDKL